MKLPSNINLRLAVLVQHFTHGNAAAFARNIHVVQQRFDRLLKPDKKTGKFPMVKPEIISSILAEYPSVNEIWLLSGAGSMLNTIEDPPSSFLSVSLSGVPHYLADFMHEFDLIKNKHAASIGYQIDFKIFNHADFWCHVTGRSMEPEIASGDIVAMKEVADKEHGILYGEIYGIVTKNFCTVRRVAKSGNNQYLTLIPSNKSAEYAEQEIPHSAILHIFQILCCVKKL